jgi:stress-induced-phosphoprotein 1
MSDPKTEASAHKAKGNEFYKARKFDEAIEQYQKAWDLDKVSTRD